MYAVHQKITEKHVQAITPARVDIVYLDSAVNVLQPTAQLAVQVRSFAKRSMDSKPMYAVQNRAVEAHVQAKTPAQVTFVCLDTVVFARQTRTATMAMPAKIISRLGLQRNAAPLVERNRTRVAILNHQSQKTLDAENI